jgi:hypothetical protein
VSCRGCEPLDPDSFLEHLKTLCWYQDQVCLWVGGQDGQGVGGEDGWPGGAGCKREGAIRAGVSCSGCELLDPDSFLEHLKTVCWYQDQVCVCVCVLFGGPPEVVYVLHLGDSRSTCPGLPRGVLQALPVSPPPLSGVGV